MAVSRRLLPVDIMLLVYLTITAMVAGVRIPAHPRAVGFPVANGAMVALILLVTRQDLGRVGRLVREVYPLLLLLARYAAVDLLNGGGTVTTYDRTVQGWEQRLFGGQVSREWWRHAPSVVWSTTLHGAYFAY